MRRAPSAARALLERASAPALLLFIGCAPQRSQLEARVPPSHRSAPAQQATTSARTATIFPESIDPSQERFRWRPTTRSPRPASAPDPADEPLIGLCGKGDLALNQVAARIAERQAGRLAPLDVAQITFALRAAGVPYVWPRVWSLQGAALDPGDARSRFARWLGTFHDGGERRCGIADVHASDGQRVIEAVAVDVLADISPLPTRVRPGRWLTVRARLLVPATAAGVVVLGPRGAPKSVPTTLHHGQVEATFSADQPGGWLVQVVATVQTGPRPVAEAMIQAGGSPPARFHAEPAPGENASVGAADDATRVQRMLNAARKLEGLKPLQRDARLDRIALSHAAAMQKRGELGHDVGDGSPADRVAALGLAVKSAGENVAHARTLRRAHRALWASPSHRDNLLHPSFNALGVGVARDPDGSVWVCEVFAQLG